uniref:Uncharacterized protein n=1 Tax=Fagus sylvatica TaxID=28930 RepID=A0A2N9GGH0_FAGSY
MELMIFVSKASPFVQVFIRLQLEICPYNLGLLQFKDVLSTGILLTEIEWYRGKSLTQKILKKKPRKGSKNAKSSTKTEDCPSFFNFFIPPQSLRRMMILMKIL